MCVRGLHNLPFSVFVCACSFYNFVMLKLFHIQVYVRRGYADNL